MHAAESPRVTGLFRYPLKSAAGLSVALLELEPWGPAGDRRWMVVDGNGRSLTAREHPRMLLLGATVTPDGLRVTAPDRADLQVRRPRGEPETVFVHSSPAPVVAADDAAHTWFTDLLGVPARLVHQADPAGRPSNPAFSTGDDRVSLADGYPLHVTTTASLAALDDLVAAGRFPDQWPVSMRRFRPNLVVDGTPAWAEDGWRRLRIGHAEFRAVKGCDRCVLTTIDPDTSDRGREPLASLVKHRRWDGRSWFGMNLIPDTPGAAIAVGDPVEILEAVEHPDGPPR